MLFLDRNVLPQVTTDKFSAKYLDCETTKEYQKYLNFSKDLTVADVFLINVNILLLQLVEIYYI